MSIIIGIDHGYYAIKTAHCSFPAGLTSYGEHEPYTRQGLLELAGCFFVCGTGRQPIQRDKTANDNYYLLTLAAIAKEIKQRGLPPECSVRIAAGLPLTSFGRDKPKFRDYLFRTQQPVHFRFEGVEYSIAIEEVAIFPQGYAALMFDRLGRRDDETPFVVEWFAKQGIRIFSVNEGEQKFESHTDSLINYIRYWQSEGESKKTSIRIKTRLDQLRSEGLYTGGPVRYGYRAVDKGRLNKKNKPVKDLEIDPEEAEIVKEVFERTVNKGDGSFTIANDLNARGYRTKKGAKFQCMTINRMLTDRQYLGYLVTKDVTSPYLPELQIIDDKTFQMAVDIVEQRKKINAEWRSVPRRSNNGMLLGGNLYCGHCGSRMAPSCPGEGAKRSKPEYVCYKGANHRIPCDGQRLYLAERIDAVVIRVTNEIMDMIQVIPKDDAIERQMAEKIQTLSEQLAAAKCAVASAAKEQEALETEVGRCIMGQSRFSEALLSRLIDEKAAERKQLQSKAAALEMEIRSQSTLTANVSTYYDRFMGWSAEFRLADIDRKRMIVSQLYSRIEVKRGYEIKLVLDANYRQFLDGKIDYGVGYLIEKTDIRHRKPIRQISKLTA